MNKVVAYSDGIELGVESGHSSVVEVKPRHFCRENREQFTQQSQLYIMGNMIGGCYTGSLM